MNLDSFTGSGSTASRRKFWDQVTQAVIASQKVAGKNVSVDERQGYGSLISINPERAGPLTPTCCGGAFESSIQVTFSGIENCDCVVESTSPAKSYQADITGLNGIYVLTGGSGTWSFDFETTIHATVFDTVDCTEPPDSTTDDFDVTVHVDVGCSSAFYVAQMTFSIALVGNVFFGGGGPTIINGNVCTTSPTGIAGHGGTAVIECL